MYGKVLLTWRLFKLLKRSHRAVKEFGDKIVCFLIPSVNDLDNTLNGEFNKEYKTTLAVEK